MSEPKIRVFISYAWESQEFKESIWALAGWLHTNSAGKIDVITDHIHENRPPEKGWQIWMQDEIDQCSIVLIICTPKYRARFQKEDDGQPGGAGVTFEGAIITADLYASKLRNNKFFPILPQNGDVANIPTILQAYNNNHSFPDGNARILKLIFNDNPTHLSEITTLMSGVPVGVKNGSLEKEIVNEIIVSLDNNEKQHMLSPVQMLVRSYMSLDDINKNRLCQVFGLASSLLNQPTERDKEIFKTILSNDQISKFWDEINSIQPFENTTNPFLTIQNHDTHS